MKNTLEDAVVAREINREEMIQEAKNRQARYEDTKNNFFNTLTSGYQAFQGAMNSNKQPASSNNPFGQSYNPYGQPAGYHQSNFGGSAYGQAPYGKAPYGQAPYGQPQHGGGFAQMGSNLYPQFPQYPGYPQQPGPSYPRGY